MRQRGQSLSRTAVEYPRSLGRGQTKGERVWKDEVRGRQSRARSLAPAEEASAHGFSAQGCWRGCHDGLGFSSRSEVGGAVSPESPSTLTLSSREICLPSLGHHFLIQTARGSPSGHRFCNFNSWQYRRVEEKEQEERGAERRKIVE